MPVTLTTADHSPHNWGDRRLSTTEELFQHACPEDYSDSRKLLQGSFPSSLFEDSHISDSEHGFIWSVFRAYSNHHHLILRPEDVWFSILTQLNFFVNAHAEELRHYFVAHEGQKELEVIGWGSVDTANFGALAMLMTQEIEKNVLDKELRAWIMPDFTTTTETDHVVAAILMMGALQKYFTYKMCLLCGIPSVTLLGEREDWVTLVNKLAKLHQLGDEPARFAQLLRPVLNHFVASFDTPESPAVREFWSKCAHRESMASGPSYLSGWISTFCFWNEDGIILFPESILPKSTPEFITRNTELDLRDALSRCIDTDKIPSGFASVPVTVNDNGIIHDTMMVAGLIGIQATSSRTVSDGASNPSDGGLLPPTEAGFDSIQPLSGWWMYEK